MKSKLRACTVHAPCKINLHLEVRGRRPDGFHDLESLFAALAFGDDLRFEIAAEEGFWDLSVTGMDERLAADFCGNNNLVSKAVAIFRRKTGCKLGLSCVLDKKVPLGSGLGGGSSDAAAALAALNLLSGLDLPFGELLEMAAGTGSDVPFFLYGGAAHVSGRGELIEPLPPLAGYRVLLVKPPFQSDTAGAFRLLDLSRSSVYSSSKNGIKDLKSTWGTEPEKWPYFNDFLPVLPHAEIYSAIIKGLLERGADFAALSGSGSCCFGIFKDEKNAAAAEASFVSSENIIKPHEIHQNFMQNTFFLASGADPVLE